jgi:hypothetical protein
MMSVQNRKMIQAVCAMIFIPRELRADLGRPTETATIPIDTLTDEQKAERVNNLRTYIERGYAFDPRAA